MRGCAEQGEARPNRNCWLPLVDNGEKTCGKKSSVFCWQILLYWNNPKKHDLQNMYGLRQSCIFLCIEKRIGKHWEVESKSDNWNVWIIKIPNFSQWFHGSPTLNFSTRAIYKEQIGLGTSFQPYPFARCKEEQNDPKGAVVKIPAPGRESGRRFSSPSLTWARPEGVLSPPGDWHKTLRLWFPSYQLFLLMVNQPSRISAWLWLNSQSTCWSFMLSPLPARHGGVEDRGHD